MQDSGSADSEMPDSVITDNGEHRQGQERTELAAVLADTDGTTGSGDRASSPESSQAASQTRQRRTVRLVA